ncbi:salicylic acid-binding protein 2-like [Macadamia integrifolia]|uniref:salicylic acid-binding protein 2-like n=1 Tax=Macadamia integrifolia TaxID=60698 RepID=UPI001C4EA9B5|nr:salicylic acid-binding protein 2-like [Macadamia integrifolia]
METKEEKKHHFVLVHGACHGAWCWYKLATLLRSAGHRVTAPDLAASGINPKQKEEIRSISDYFQPLMEILASLPPDDKVILEGHSLGGVSISAAMEKFPHKISVAVFAAALMPRPDFIVPKSLNQEFQKKVVSMVDTQYWFDDGPDNPPTALLFGPEFLASKLYELCLPEDLTLAKMLVRPISLYGGLQLLKETALSMEKYGSVSRVFIVCQEDKVLDEDYQRWMIQNNPVTEIKVFPDSDHMVMLCKPIELCTCLIDIAERYS